MMLFRSLPHRTVSPAHGYRRACTGLHNAEEPREIRMDRESKTATWRYKPLTRVEHNANRGSFLGGSDESGSPRPSYGNAWAIGHCVHVAAGHHNIHALVGIIA